MDTQPGIIETYGEAFRRVSRRHNTTLWRQEVAAETIQLVRDRKLSLGAFAYHVWRLCHPIYSMIWQKTEVRELSIDKKTITGWKAELRKVNLMSMHNLGDQTITIDRRGPLSTELIVEQEKIEIRALFAMKGVFHDVWKKEGRYDSVVRASLLMGPPWTRGFGWQNIFRWVYRWGCQQAKGAADIKAMGLLMMLWAEAPGHERSLIELGQTLKISQPTLRGYRRHLEKLGFVEFENQKLKRVHRFLVDSLSHLPDYCK